MELSNGDMAIAIATFPLFEMDSFALGIRVRLGRSGEVENPRSTVIAELQSTVLIREGGDEPISDPRLKALPKNLSRRKVVYHL